MRGLRTRFYSSSSRCTSALPSRALPKLSAYTSRSSTSPVARLQQVQRHLSNTPPNMAASTEETLVLPQSKMGLRIAHLNREKKLNSLNLPMIQQIREQISSWEESDAAKLILLRGKGRAFSAGGDVAAAAQASQEDSSRDQARSFFKNEYETNSLCAKLRTPAVVFMDGVTMGGGVGLAGHLPLRVATEKTLFAMPETSIGLFPDVGATKRLSSLPGHVGAYLALTSDRLSGVDCYRLGLATHMIPSDQLQAAEDRLAELELQDIPAQQTLDVVNQALDEFATDPKSMGEPVIIGERRTAIDMAFGHETVEEIVKELTKIASGEVLPSQHKWAQSTLDTLNMRSPTSCKVGLIAVRKAAKMNIDEVLRQDFRLATAFTNPAITQDFIKGVTKVLLEKKRDERPEWNPSSFEEVKASDLHEKFFQEAPGAQSLKLSNTKPFVDYPTSYGLPTEEYISSVVKGANPGAGAYAVDRDELLKVLRSKSSQKVGLTAHVDEILARKTQVKDGVLKWIY